MKLLRLGSDEREAQAMQRREQSRRQRREQQKRRRDGGAAETRAEPKDESRGKNRNREKQAEFRAMNVEMREPELAGGARPFIRSAQRTSKCGGNDCHAHTKETERDAFLAPLSLSVQRTRVPHVTKAPTKSMSRPGKDKPAKRLTRD